MINLLVRSILNLQALALAYRKLHTITLCDCKRYYVISIVIVIGMNNGLLQLSGVCNTIAVMLHTIPISVELRVTSLQVVWSPSAQRPSGGFG